MFSKLKKLFKGETLPLHKQEPGKKNAPEEKGGAPLSNDKPEQEGDGIAMEGPTGQPGGRKSVPALKRNRKGIRVIGKEQDVAAFFSEPKTSDDRVSYEATGVIQPSVPIVDRAPKIKISEQPKAKPRTTRNGIPILDDVDDDSLFPDAAMKPFGRRESGEIPSTVELGEKGSHGNSVRLRNKHGIPVLPELRTWDAQEADHELNNNEFMLLLNQTLGQKTRDVMMNEKGVRAVRKKPLTLKQKVKRYPMPQGQLDLHGYTAIRAELRAETYLKSANVSQLHTVIIIVGKGLHSDEGAVLPDVIETLLNRLRKDGLVLAYEWENEKKSRSGAVTVYLNNLDLD